MGECTQIFWIGFGGGSGRVPFEVSYDVQLVVYGRVYADLLDALWGAASFFNVMMQRFYFLFAAALLQKEDLVMLSMQKMKFTVYEKIPYSISLQHLDS